MKPHPFNLIWNFYPGHWVSSSDPVSTLWSTVTMGFVCLLQLNLNNKGHKLVPDDQVLNNLNPQIFIAE